MFAKQHFWFALFISLLATIASSYVVAATVSKQGLQADESGLWRDIDESNIVLRNERWISPQRYRTLALEFTTMQSRLAQAPLEQLTQANIGAISLNLPMPDGSIHTFAVVESPVMEAELAQKYPNIRTYSGISTQDPSTSIRLDVTVQGFHAQILTAAGNVYIDPYQLGDTTHYIAYAKSDYENSAKQFQCEFNDTHDFENPLSHVVTPNANRGTPAVTLRTHRIAVAANKEFTNSYGGTLADGLSGVVTTINRVNGIYIRELAVRLLLVANNDLIVYTDTNPGPLPNPPSNFGLLQSTINNAIGSANYDVGHGVGTGSGGAVTPLGNVCGASKAQGYTALSPPRGDSFDVDYVAHELGHQYGGPHTWNGLGGSCQSGQWPGATNALEPGSGVTIMAYAGICGTTNNLQPNSDSVFHGISQTRITATINSTNCGTLTVTSNNLPSVTAPANMSIPKQTPFQLTAVGGDPNGGDQVTYSWEQMDGGAQGVPSSTGNNGTAPLFRSFNPMSSPRRVFPSLQYILNNANVPPASITLPPAGSTYVPAEILPNPSTGTRVMNFRVTARDNRAEGGGVIAAAMQVTATADAGPFALTNITGSFAGGASLPVAWSVASTNLAPVNTSQVNILLSTDGGHTFSSVLANTANDGSENITLPNVATTQARIRVEAANGSGISAGNTFFDVNDANFTITSANTPVALGMGGPIVTKQGTPAAAPITLATISGGTGPYTATAVLTPPDPEIQIQSLSVNANQVIGTAFATCFVAAPNAPATRNYPVLVTVTDANSNRASGSFNVNVSNNDIPTLGAYTNLTVARGSSATATPAAIAADANNNFSGYSVAPSTLPGGGTVSVNQLTGVVTVAPGASATIGAYAIRVNAFDTCGASAVKIFTANITTPDPVLNFVSALVIGGNGILEPNECNAARITVNNIGGAAANAVSGVLSTTTPGVTITTANSGYPDIASNGSANNNLAYKISTDNSVTCGTSANFTQTVTYSGVGSPTVLNFSLPIGSTTPVNYQVGSSSGAPAVPGSSLVAGSNDDDVMVTIPLPSGFASSIYDLPVTSLQASTNGTLQFNTVSGNASNANGPLPAAAFTTPTLIGLWQDLDLSPQYVAGGGIFTSVTGSAPNRIFNIEWRAAAYVTAVPPAPIAPTLVFTARLYEGQTRVDLVYSNVAGNVGDAGNSANGAFATVGLQKAGSGGFFTQFSNQTASLSNGLQLSFTLPPPVCPAGPAPCATDTLFEHGFEEL